MSIPTPTPRAGRVNEIFDFSAGCGLEIGPLHRPLVPRDAAEVSYLDLYDRDRLYETNTDNPNVTREAIPEIDYPMWDGTRMRTLDEAAEGGAPFDWVLASHVVEHVPDLIGWLGQVEAVTAPDGALVLVVPDRRYTFDAHRPPTTVGQILQAYEAGDTTPSVRAVYDHHRSAVNGDPKRLHRHGPSEAETCVHDLGYTRTQLERARRGEYVDCHVWTYTDRSFPEIIAELRRLGLTGWAVESLLPVPENDIEFYVVLRRGLSPDLPAAPAIPDWVEQGTELREEVARLREVVADQRQRLGSQRKQLAGRRAEIDAMRGSKRWKLATALAAPLDRWRDRGSDE
ncbi:methyltransferase domain-containing protein [Nocardioides sp. NPDC006273]|uniref:class I SAM-dependent methyltransferase n=1 Tax=Nocardioides sp. NPDC006273 TaxID=3155598 RepID=UPI0033A7F550